MMQVCSVGYADESLREQAKELATQLGFNLDKDANPCLYVTVERLALKMNNNFSLLAPELTASFWNKRKQG